MCTISPWPALAPLGKLLRLNGEKETLFFYDTLGSHSTDKPLLVLIHGLGDEADSWRHLIPLLEEKFRVLAPDLPGFGRSAAPGRINVKRHIRAVIRLLEAAGADTAGPALLAGNSMGALIAEGVAVFRPGLVKGLILIDGAFPSPVKLGGGFLFLCLPFLGKMWYRGFRKNHQGAYESLFPYYAGFAGLDEKDKNFLRERVIARVESPSQERAYFASLRSLVWAYWKGGAGFVRSIKTFLGAENRAKKLLFIWGERDVIMPQKSADIIRRLCPEASFTVIPGAGHLPQQEKPAETAAVILGIAGTE